LWVSRRKSLLVFLFCWFFFFWCSVFFFFFFFFFFFLVVFCLFFFWLFGGATSGSYAPSSGSLFLFLLPIVEYHFLRWKPFSRLLCARGPSFPERFRTGHHCAPPLHDPPAVDFLSASSLILPGSGSSPSSVVSYFFSQSLCFCFPLPKNLRGTKAPSLTCPNSLRAIPLQRSARRSVHSPFFSL